MEGTWICPQCETSNENTDKCIVCGMDYASAVMIYKKYSTEKIEKEKVIKKRQRIFPLWRNVRAKVRTKLIRRVSCVCHCSGMNRWQYNKSSFRTKAPKYKTTGMFFLRSSIKCRRQIKRIARSKRLLTTLRIIFISISPFH